MKFTIETQTSKKVFIPYVISIVVETPKELDTLATVLDALPHHEKWDSLCEEVQALADEWGDA